MCGFSLLEILVVVAIISILSLIIIPNYRGHIERAKMTKTRALIVALGTAITSYHADNRRYPLSGSDFLWKALTGPYQDDPRWNGPYMSFEGDQLIEASELSDAKMPKFSDGTTMIPSSAQSGAGYKFIVDSWGRPLMYVRNRGIRAAADDYMGVGIGYEQTTSAEYSPFFAAWDESLAVPPGRDNEVMYKNYATFQLYSVGPDGVTQQNDGGPGTLSYYDNKDNDQDGLVDDKDHTKTTKNDTLPEDDINNW